MGVSRVYTAHPDEFSGYTTSVIGNKSLEWLEEIAPSGRPFAVRFENWRKKEEMKRQEINVLNE